MLAACLAGCGAGSPVTEAPAAPSVLRSPPQAVTFDEVARAIDRLYRARPGIRSFVVRDVEYSPPTRDKVLRVCREGGIELDRAALESSRIAGCAPLVFFFYSYGRRRSAPESVAVAQKLYWYAARSIRGPFDARASLSALLRSWGVE